MEPVKRNPDRPAFSQFLLDAGLAAALSMSLVTSPAYAEDLNAPESVAETISDEAADIAEDPDTQVQAATEAAPVQLAEPLTAAGAGSVPFDQNPLPSSGGSKRFPDVAQSDKFYPAITWMYQSGLTTGISTPNGQRYLQKNRLSREAMAAFMYRQAGSPSFSMPSQKFIDVPRSHKFYKPIMWMKAEGYTTGVQTKRGMAFQPSSRLTREAMAAFMYRQAGRPAFTAPQQFSDVKRSHKFYTPIMWMRATGLTTGMNQGGKTIYGGSYALTREAMAAFMYRQAGSPGFITSGDVRIASVLLTEGVVTRAVINSSSAWSPMSNLAFTYQWKRNGSAIPGATGPSYAVTAADVGAKLQVAGTGSMTGVKPVTVTSQSVTPLKCPNGSYPSGSWDSVIGMHCTLDGQGGW